MELDGSNNLRLEESCMGMDVPPHGEVPIINYPRDGDI